MNFITYIPLRISFISLWFIFSLYSHLAGQDEVRLSSPYHAIYNHLNNLNDNNYYPKDAALSFPPQFPLSVREEMARRLKMVYDARAIEVDFNAIPKNSDYVDSLSLNAVYTPFPYDFPEIQLEKSGDTWLYTVTSAIQIEEMYREAFPLWAENMMEKLPQTFQTKFFGIAGWQYLGFLVLILLLVLVNYILSYFIDLIILRFVYQNQKLETTHSKLVYKIATFISVVIMIYLFKYFVTKLLLPVHISKVMLILTDIVHTLVILFLLFYVISLVKIYLLKYTAQTENKLDDQLAPVFIKGLKIIIGFIAFMHILALLGVNITALIAGASIGGLALALAAQDTFKNMFGSIMVFLDKPFEIGDFIITSDIEGTVDNVGLRSTRIRKIDTSVISVPNGNLANTTITNLGKRLNRILEMNIGVLYSTSADKLGHFIQLLRGIPARHNEVSPENQLVYLRNLADSAIVIYFRVYIVAATFDEELAVRERIIFNIIGCAEEAGVSFAFPSTSVYLEPTQVTEKLSGFKTT
jgi:MscS family membrane protein